MNIPKLTFLTFLLSSFTCNLFAGDDEPKHKYVAFGVRANTFTQTDFQSANPSAWAPYTQYRPG